MVDGKMLPEGFQQYNFWADLTKAEEEVGSDGEVTRKIAGLASNEQRDLQGEYVLQKGLDYDYFLNHGYFNDDHRKGVAFKVGEPESAEVTMKGFFTEGFLYKGKQAADAIWEHMQALKKSPNTRRRMGFSIEGKVLRRGGPDGKTILKSWIQDVAVTAAPINTATFVDVLKSLSRDFASRDEIAEYEASIKSVNLIEYPMLDDYSVGELTRSVSTPYLSEKEAVDLIKSQTKCSADTAREALRFIQTFMMKSTTGG